MKKLLLLFLAALPLRAADDPPPLTTLARMAPQHTIEGSLLLRNYSHPKKRGDFHEERLQLRLATDTDRAAIAATFTPAEGKRDRFVLRGTELLEANEPEPKPADGIGDLHRLTLAKLDPIYIAALVDRHAENARRVGDEVFFAYGDELWRIRMAKGDIATLHTSYLHDLYGDVVETIRYEEWRDRGGVRFPSRISVSEDARLKALLEVASVRPGADDELLRGSRVTPTTIYEDDVELREIAPHLFAIELVPTDSRVFVAEFEDHLYVIEGAYHDRNAAVLAREMKKRFPDKPIRYFSFSHIHGQYVGGVRTYAARGAKVVTTPSGAEVVRDIAAAKHRDGLTVNPEIDVVAESRDFEDATNSLVVYNVDSQHTDDYSIFYFPRQKVLLSGDLLCYRGKETPLRGRSKHLCETIAKLGIEVDRFYPTWPLESYGCLSPVSGSDFAAACGRE